MVCSSIVGSLCGCNGSRAEAESPRPASEAASPALQEQARRAGQLGTALYRYQLAATKGQQALDQHLAGQAPPDDMRGPLVFDEGSRWRAVFYAYDTPQDACFALYTVLFEPDGTDFVARVEHHELPLDVDPRPCRARDRVTRLDLPRCGSAKSYTLLPAKLDDARGFYVYALSTAERPDLASFGGHQRLHVNEEGDEILARRDFTKSCLELPVLSQTNALVVSHGLDEHPTELHMFQSLVHSVPLMVVTTSNKLVWRIGPAR